MNAVVEDVPRMEPETADELALAERVSKGDESALNVLYERHADSLFGYIYHALNGARQEAEEVWQDTLSSAIRGISSYRGQSRFFSWLCSIARHKLADYWRHRSPSSQKLLLLPPADLANLIDNAPLPDELVNERATCLRVAVVLGRLSPEYRTALVARYADGQHVEEVARLLGKSYKAAESTLSRAKQAFRVELSRNEEIDL
jgi:RNA polymerase sigma-70 factor (ECF subfamily)